MKYAKDIKLTFLYIKKHKLLATITMLILIAATFSEGVGTGMLIPILHSLIGKGGSNAFVSFAKTVFSAAHVRYSFINLMIVFGFVMILKFGLVALQQYTVRLMSATATCELREKAFKSLMSQPLSYYYTHKVGDIIATVYTSCQNAGATIEILFRLLVALLFFSVYLFINLMISVPLTIIVCLLTTVSYFLVLSKFKIAFIQGEEEKSVTDKISSFLHDKFSGIKTIKVFNNEALHVNDFMGLAKAFKWVQIKIQSNRILAALCTEPIVTILVIVLIVFSIEVLHIPVVYLLAFFYIFGRMIRYVYTMNDSYLEIMSLLPHFSITQKMIEKKDKAYLPDGTEEIDIIKQGIEFKKVFFKYPSSKEFVIKNFNALIEKNKTTAVVGGSGGGKTTIVDLILRLHDPQEGFIEVDGLDLRKMKTERWHRLVSIVEQDAYLFNDTVYNNIIYGKLNATQEEVVNAAKLAYAHDFIQELPDKYDTLVGERGMKLSGGQKQRIALARALIGNPELLILDEATNALDSESERLIQESVKNLSGNKTIIIIAHRLSTIIHADKIVVVENGRIVEEGSHEVLLRQEGMYKKYYSLQGNVGLKG